MGLKSIVLNRLKFRRGKFSCQCGNIAVSIPRIIPKQIKANPIAVFMLLFFQRKPELPLME